MLKDYHKILVKREVVTISDGFGGFTELTHDYEFKGFIHTFSGQQRLFNMQLGTNAIAQVFTEETLDVTDRIVDGNIIYEVVFPYNNFHKYYDLKLSENIPSNQDTNYFVTQDNLLFVDDENKAFITN